MSLTKSQKAILCRMHHEKAYIKRKNNVAALIFESGEEVPISETDWNALYWPHYIDTNGVLWGAAYYRINLKGKEVIE